MRQHSISITIEETEKLLKLRDQIDHLIKENMVIDDKSENDGNSSITLMRPEKSDQESS
jgi:hypothetical protein